MLENGLFLPKQTHVYYNTFIPEKDPSGAFMSTDKTVGFESAESR